MALKLICLVGMLQILYCNAGNSTEKQVQFSEKNYNKSLQLKQSGCECLQYTCGCCVYMDVPKMHLNVTGCMNITYLPKEYGIKVTVTIDKWDLINVTVSAKNPPPLCFGEEFFEEHADICIRFYDLNATYTSLHGCAQLLARLEKIILARYELGCIDLGKNNELFPSLENAILDGEAKLIHVPKVFSSMIYKTLKSQETKEIVVFK